ncbi:sulfotransferase [Maritimibacter fusiformis]|nr:sulfotransferase [Maritimibacter fusiformis]
MHRSGTTWMGTAFSKARNSVVLHEPLNFASGVRGVPSWYPEVRTHAEAVILRKMVNQIVTGKAKYRMRRSSDGPMKAIVRVLTSGGPDYWTYRKQMKSSANHMILKDPFAMRLSLWLANEFDFRVLILVRHPCALYGSLKRMHWPIPLLSDNGVYGHLEAGVELEPEARAREFGLLWRRLYGDARAQALSASGRIMLLRHEDLSLRPLEEAQKGFNHLGVEMTLSARKFLIESTTGDVVVPPEKVLHSMNRDAAKLVHLWKERLSNTEIQALTDAAGLELEAFYPDFRNGHSESTPS